MGNDISIKNRFSRYFFMGCLAIIIVTAMSYSLYSSHRMLSRYHPLIDAAMEIKLEVTTAHLWFEEIISGDRYESFANITEHIQHAHWYAWAMLEGGENQEGVFLPLSDQELRKKVIVVLDQLQVFESITLKRYAAIDVSGAGSAMDQEYDSLFKLLISQVDEVETRLQHKIVEDFNQYKIIQVGLIIAIILLSILSFFIQYRYDREQIKALTELNAARHRAEKNEQWLDITMNSMGDGVITTDVDGRITRMNPVAELLTGWLLSEAKGKALKTCFPIIDASTRETIDNPVEKVISTGETVFLSNHTTLVAKDGTEYQIADSAAPIRDADSNILGMVLVFNDVTEQYRLRATLAESRRNLQAIMDHSPAVIYVKDVEGRYSFVNQKFETLFHLQREELVGKTDYEIFPQKFATEFQRNDKAVLAAGHAIESEELVPQDDGLHHYVSTKFPLSDNKKNTYAVCGISTDITQRKQAEQDIIDSAQRLADAQVIAHIGDWELQLPGNQLIWSDEIYRIFELDPQTNNVDYEAFLERIHPEDRDKVNAAYLDSVKNKTLYNIEHRLLMADGRIKYVHERGKTYYDEAGEPVRSVGAVQDITERNDMEHKLRRSQKMDALSKIVGGLAHDYNNMLGVITGYTGLLKRKYKGVEGAEKFLDEIIRASERGKALTRKMLNFSRPESSHAEICNINETLKHFSDMLVKSLTAVVQVQFHLVDEDWLVWVDVAELEDSILNLAINAKYAMPEGGVLSITTQNISLAEKEASFLGLAPNDYLKLTVTDTGIGIEKSMQDKVFDPFFTTKGEAGNGLGLSQVFGFMERSGGAINLYSQIGQGTQFSLYFPRYLQNNNEEAQGISHVEITPHLSGDETILVVDDEPALRELARQILLDAGYHVLTAGDGQEALNMLLNQTVDLVLSDVIMPNMGGYQLARQVTDQYPHVKIQLTSGFSGGQAGDMQDSPLRQSLLDKPYEAHELLTRMRLLLDGYILPKEGGGAS